MAKLRTAPLNVADIETCLDSCSDFSFEMEVAAALAAAGVSIEHSGTYIDPVTGKARQFDIRGVRSCGSLGRIWLAVECKNIRPYCPIVLQAVPRLPDEAFLSGLVFRKDPSYIPGLSTPSVVRVSGIESLYRPNDLVAKSVDQVGITTAGEPSLGDGDIFDKHSQALNSVRDLIVRAAHMWEMSYAHVFLPVLVVPENCLFQAAYSASGTRTGPPVATTRAPLFVNRSWPCGLEKRSETYVISHIEYTTPSGLLALLNSVTPEAPWLWRLSSSLV